MNRTKYVHYYVRLYSVCRKVNSSVLAANRRGTIYNGSCNNDLLLLEAHYKFNGKTLVGDSMHMSRTLNE